MVKMHRRSRWGLGLVAVLLLCVTGCRSQAPLPDPPLNFSVPKSFGGASSPTGAPVQDWFCRYNDPQLQGLIDEALAHNTDLQEAAARLRAAEAEAVRAGAQLKPTVAVGASASREKSLKRGDKSRQRKGISLDVSWELDLWGRLAAQKNAARAEYEAHALDHAYARRSLAAQVAKAWFQAVETRLQLSLGRSFVVNYQKQLELTRLRYDMGEAALKDLSLIRAELFNGRQDYLRSQAVHEQALRHLELLVGRYPAAEIEVADRLPISDTTIPPGLPSQLLDRRPDVAAARKRLEAAARLKEAAQKARLPKFALTSSVGSVSSRLKDVVTASASDNILNLAANLLAPLYEGGRLQVDVDIAAAGVQMALAAYARTALTAFSEVETALSNGWILGQRLGHLQQVVKENQKALELVRFEYESGESDMIDLLLVQLRVNRARAEFLRVKHAAIVQQINLFLALGGGFDAAENQGNE